MDFGSVEIEVANLLGMYSARQDQQTGLILPNDPQWTPHIDKTIAELEIKIKEYETKNGVTLYKVV